MKGKNGVVASYLSGDDLEMYLQREKESAQAPSTAVSPVGVFIAAAWQFVPDAINDRFELTVDFRNMPKKAWDRFYIDLKPGVV